MSYLKAIFIWFAPNMVAMFDSEECMPIARSGEPYEAGQK